MSSSSPPLRVYNEDEGTEPLIVSYAIDSYIEICIFYRLSQ